MVDDSGVFHLQPSMTPTPPQPVVPGVPASLTPDRQGPSKRARLQLINQSYTDKLGELLHQNVSLVSSIGLAAAMQHRRGRPDWGALRRVSNHPASRLLHSYNAQGVPCTLADSPWTAAEKTASMQRGPHQSAYEHISFLRDDMADMSDKGFWMILPFDLVASSPHLRLSPIGVVPQRARRPRPIVDYTYFGVNATTQPNAAFESMQFGRTFERLLRKIVLANPRYGPIHLSKTDLADGFYRLYLTFRASLNLAVTFPSLPGEPPLVAIPLTLPMGWTNSPPLFCTATETIADVTNQRLLQRHVELPHRLESCANQQPPLPPHFPAAFPRCAVPIPTTRDPALAHTLNDGALPTLMSMLMTLLLLHKVRLTTYNMSAAPCSTPLTTSSAHLTRSTPLLAKNPFLSKS